MGPSSVEEGYPVTTADMGVSHQKMMGSPKLTSYATETKVQPAHPIKNTISKQRRPDLSPREGPHKAGADLELI
jgi:hypothetical protein